MSIAPHRLLAFAFTAADLLIELDPNGHISLALGAAVSVTGLNQDALMGCAFSGLFSPADQAVADAMILGLVEGGRRGPTVLRLAGQPTRTVSLMAHVMAGNDGRTCVLASRASRATVETRPDGLLTPGAFRAMAGGLIDAAGRAGCDLELALVEFAGLDEACHALEDGAARALRATIAGVVRAESESGTAAAALSSERFAILRRTGEDAAVLADRLGVIARRRHAAAPLAVAQALSVNASSDIQRIGRAMGFALEHFARAELDPGASSLGEALDEAVKETLARAGDLGAIITGRDFKLAYQPVVRLSDGSAHHHEVLVRFKADESPFETIRMAEEFGLIEELDKAVLDKVARQIRLDTKGGFRLAVNVSGRTITSDSYITTALFLLKDPAIKGRLHFEVTESAAISDMYRADRCIQALRRAGARVCLDDYGSGASTLSYLQQLTVDIVKIDGRYIRNLDSSERDAALVRHLVQLCGELGVLTVAESVETAHIADLAREAGIDFAQGWLYGQPTERPLPPILPSMAIHGRRLGLVESWG